MNKSGKKQRNKTLKSEGKNGAQKGKKQHAHLNIKESSQIAADANINKLVYTHFVLGEIDKSASMKIIEQQYKGEVIFSDDLMSLNCGNKTTN